MSLTKTIEHLQKNALPKSSGQCAKFVREAIEAGFGIKLDRAPGANFYGPSLEKAGFKKVFDSKKEDKKNYHPSIGDIAIIIYKPFGHICMLTPTGWISDFKQIDMYGGSIRKQNPHFCVYSVS